MDTSKEKVALDGFVDRKTASKILDVNLSNLPMVVSEFNIETKLVGPQKLYYKVKDLENAICKADEFHATHYLGKYVYENIASVNVLNKRNIKIVNIPAHYRCILRSKYNAMSLAVFYKREDIDCLKEAIDAEKRDGDTIEGYLDRASMIEALEIVDKSYKMNNLVKGFNLATKTNNGSVFYRVEDVERAINELKIFFDSHYFAPEAKKIVTYRSIDTKGVEKVDIPKHYSGLLRKTYSTKSGRVAYRKDEIDAIRNEIDRKANKATEAKEIVGINKKKQEGLERLVESDKYVDSVEALKRLSFAPTNFRTLKTLREGDYLGVITVKTKHYYSSKDIKSIIRKREEFFKEYAPIGSSQCNKYFEEHGTKLGAHSYRFKRHEVPLYCLGCTEKYGESYSGKGALKIADIEECLKKYEERAKSIIDKSISGETSFETFLIRLEGYAYWEGFEEKSPYTKSKFVEYVQKNLSKETSKKTTDIKIRKNINLGVAIKNLLDRYNIDEVYLLSDAQINLYLRTIDFKTLKIDLYTFLSHVNIDLKKLGLVSKLNFKFNNIVNPRKGNSVEILENAEKDLYDFEIYAKVFNFLSNVDNHVSQVIEELYSEDSVIYASVWLYLMLHMNNAWRNGDCNRFPELVVKDLIEEYEIDSIEWFRDNRLTLAQSHSVVFRVRQWEMRMSKTQMNGVFFCSDELAPALATAVMILHLYKYNHSIISSDIESKLIMDFGNDDNDVSRSMIRKFFKPANIKGFKFSSKKFNKSIMTYIYYIANLNGDSKALVYAREMRKHLNADSTAHYVDFDIKKIESMSKQLFARGEFGYIPALLAQKILGDEETGSFDEMTNRIQTINAVFDDVQNINNTTKFLNVIRSERQNVVDMITEKSFEECQEIATDIFARNLSSKYGSDIQCLFSKEGCKMPNLDDEDDCSCFDCPYHIPSIYALTRLCNSLMNNYKEYLGLPKTTQLKDFKNHLLESASDTSTLSKKSRMQLGLKIERRKVLLAESIRKYGAEYVYRCLNIDREEFKFLSNFVKLDFYERYPELL